MITDLETVARLAVERKDEFEVMLNQLQFDDELTDAVIDARVDTIAAPIVAAIDCTECGNCCRAFTIHIYPEDILRLSTATSLTEEAVREQYIDQPPDLPSDVWGQFKQQPCSFLTGNRCSIYEHRPEACRDFPTFTPDFRWTLDYLIHNAKICPIVYNVLSAMLAETDQLQQNL